MSKHTPRPRNGASPAVPALVAEIEQTTTAPDGSVTVNRATMREAKPRPPHPYGNFAVLSLSTVTRIAAEVSVTRGQEMTARDFRVFLYVVGSVEFANFVPLSAGAIGEALKIDRAHVSRCLKRLVHLGILVADRLNDRPGYARRYYLAPSLVWKGSTVDLSRVQPEERKLSDPAQKTRRARTRAAVEWAALRDARLSAEAVEDGKPRQDDPAASLPPSDTLPLFGP